MPPAARYCHRIAALLQTVSDGSDSGKDSLILAVGFPFYYGADGRGVYAALIWVVGMAVMAVATGWRHENTGLANLFIMGLTFAAPLNVAIFSAGGCSPKANWDTQ